MRFATERKSIERKRAVVVARKRKLVAAAQPPAASFQTLTLWCFAVSVGKIGPTKMYYFFC